MQILSQFYQGSTAANAGTLALAASQQMSLPGSSPIPEAHLELWHRERKRHGTFTLGAKFPWKLHSRIKINDKTTGHK